VYWIHLLEPLHRGLRDKTGWSSLAQHSDRSVTQLERIRRLSKEKMVGLRIGLLANRNNAPMRFGEAHKSNRRVLGNYSHHLGLRNLSVDRGHALGHVVAALSALQSLSDDVEDLRERVAAPEILERQIPAEVYMSIRRGLNRLGEGRLKAKERGEEAIHMILTYEG
jgi:hypothetical protein